MRTRLMDRAMVGDRAALCWQDTACERAAIFESGTVRIGDNQSV